LDRLPKNLPFSADNKDGQARKIMGVLDSVAASNPFAAAASAVESRRAQVAQYAIYNAAKKMSEGNYDDAVKSFKTALAFDSQNTTAHTYMGKIYQSQEKYTESIAEFKKVVDLDNTSTDARNNLANAYMRAKQYDLAEEQFKSSASLDPTDPVADYTLGIMYSEMERYKDAEGQFKKVQIRSPRDANVSYSLGALYNKMGKPEEAVKQLKLALTQKSDFAAANYELGAAYATLGETDKAEKQLEVLVSKDTGLASDLLFLLEKPAISYIEESENISFNSQLGSGTPLWMMNPSQFSTPGATMQVAVSIQFSNEMNASSVMNPSNWDISRARDMKGGFYNDMMPVGSSEVSIPNRPFSVSYDPSTHRAKVYFLLSQNSSIDLLNGNRGATIDPSHLAFKFSGIDAAGRKMSTAGDQITGFSMRSY
jgi:tetratricopeptide (TPR) repeat protein